MSIRLPSRYEDLDRAFRGRLRPVPALLDIAQRARRSISVNGGIRFVPIYGESGSGKSSAARELGTHLPAAKVVEVPRIAINSFDELKNFLREQQQTIPTGYELLAAVVDQYEEAVAAKGDIPSQFVEWLSLLDRDPEFNNVPWLFLWLTTSRDFQQTLEAATSRNRRILAVKSFELHGPSREEWPTIIEETFEFHNAGKPLADYAVLPRDVEDIGRSQKTIGATIERVGDTLAEHLPLLQDLSLYQVVMLWPVTDGQRINTILRFVDPREGYRLDWNAWYRQLNDLDRSQLPLAEFNRARLYFDVRLVPIAAADLHPLCRSLDNEDFKLHKTYTDRFELTHYVSILRGTWDPARYAPLRERPSERASEARDWYTGVTTQPTKIGRRLAKVLNALGIPSRYEQDVASPHGAVRADVLSERPMARQSLVITEIKAFSPENTIPSQIRDAVRTTLRRHAQFGGFLQRQ
jgi:hypothetical protein